MSHQENSPISITPGAIRFNTDSMKLEYFRIGMEGGSTSSYAGIGTLAAGEWVQITTDSPDIQTGGTRGLFAGGSTSPALVTTIDYINVDSTGNAADFGDLTTAAVLGAGCASRVRGIFGLGATDPATPASDTINFVTISSTGNASDFGNLTVGRRSFAGCSDSTRGLFAGGAAPGVQDVIDYVTIESTGNAVDFGNLTATKTELAGCASATRGIFAGRNPGANFIDFVTISTLGNAADFGDLTRQTPLHCGACSNSVRGLFGGHDGPAPTISNIIDYITIATLGNAVDFGDLTRANREVAAVASPTRGVWGGGYYPAVTDTIDYVQIMSTGNAVDFGNLQNSRGRFAGSCSNGHGGLG